jgi:hypothetical protein
MNPILFYTTEPRFGCSQPVKSGDLLRIKSSNLYKSRFAGKPIFLIDAYNSLDDIMARGLVDSHIIIFSSSELEWFDEAG